MECLEICIILDFEKAKNLKQLNKICRKWASHLLESFEHYRLLTGIAKNYKLSHNCKIENCNVTWNYLL